MGSPEPPQDDQHDFDPSAMISVPIDPLDDADEASDDSDTAQMDYDYAGYQPLPGDDELNTNNQINEDDDDDQTETQVFYLLLSTGKCLQ